METIEVRYKPLGPGIYHKYILYTDANGNRFAARGDSANFDDLPLSGFPLGDIETEHGPYVGPDPVTGEGGFPDWVENDNAHPSETIKTGDDLSKDWENIKRAIDDIGKEQHPYNLNERNSNTTVDEALRRAGLPEPELDDWGENWSPGSGNDLGDGKSVLERILDGLKDLYERARDAFTPPRRDPLVLDLDGDGLETSGLDERVHFDHDGDGFAERTGWAGADDGLLALDRNGNGSIDNGTELFGDQTPLIGGGNAANGFQALAEYDDNGDGKIDLNDDIWTSLKIWRDSDQNGISWEGELFNLSDFNITAIQLASTPTGVPDGQGNTQSRIGRFETADGTTGQIGEYRFARDLADTVVYNTLPVPADIAALPNVRGSGTVYDLHQALVRDGSGQLRTLVETFVTQTSPADRTAILEQLLITWTGTDDIVPGSRGPNMDARRLAVLEKFMGEGFEGRNGPNPIAEAAAPLNAAYRDLAESVYAQLMVKAHLQDLYGLITNTVDPVKQKLVVDMSSVITQLQTELTTDPESGKVRLSEFARTLRGLGLQDTVNYLSFRETFIQQDESLGFVIDSGGLPFRPQTNLYGHYLGTNQAEAMLRDPTRGDAFINGYSGADVLYGSDRHEYLIQELGDSVLIAGGGNDRILAGAGDDLLDGGPGNDLLYGEAGSDTYIFRRGSGRDVIFDANVPHVYAQIAQAIQKPQLRV